MKKYIILGTELGLFDKVWELHIKSIDAVLKNLILVELLEVAAFIYPSNNSISDCVSPIISYLNLPFLQLFTFLHPWNAK